MEKNASIRFLIIFSNSILSIFNKLNQNLARVFLGDALSNEPQGKKQKKLGVCRGRGKYVISPTFYRKKYWSLCCRDENDD